MLPQPNKLTACDTTAKRPSLTLLAPQLGFCHRGTERAKMQAFARGCSQILFTASEENLKKILICNANKISTKEDWL